MLPQTKFFFYFPLFLFFHRQTNRQLNTKYSLTSSLLPPHRFFLLVAPSSSFPLSPRYFCLLFTPFSSLLLPPHGSFLLFFPPYFILVVIRTLFHNISFKICKRRYFIRIDKSIRDKPIDRRTHQWKDNAFCRVANRIKIPTMTRQ